MRLNESLTILEPLASIISEIGSLVRVQFRPKLIMLEAIQILTRKKIVIPSYRVLANIIVDAINRRSYSLKKIVDDYLNKNQYNVHSLMTLINKDLLYRTLEVFNFLNGEQYIPAY
ncbi:MAG: hypothetical protein C5B43_00125 [Verrucomicrobia bacterium]|nr:MAG: hypothetical protein C5B43_00125 [Verrucomicrobiota bacterium]